MDVSFSIVLLVGLALLFDYLNGFHDSANAIATVVSTRVLSPRAAVIIAAVSSFSAFLVFGLHVAGTIGKNVIDISIVDNNLIFATLIGACSWNIITWYFGLPTSSSHALIGGLVGAALVKAGPSALLMPGILKIIAFILLSPTIGLLLGLTISVIVHRIFQHSTPNKVDHIFRKGQILSAALYSMGHGGNDAQKTMGIIMALLISNGMMAQNGALPLWVVLSCQAALALGVMSGGWRIVKTMGQKVSKLRPVDGFCAETGSAITLFATSIAGIPVSTTHTITGSIMGVGAMRRFSAVRWGVAGQIVWAWVMTIPAAAAISAGAYLLAANVLHL